MLCIIVLSIQLGYIKIMYPELKKKNSIECGILAAKNVALPDFNRGGYNSVGSLLWCKNISMNLLFP